LKIRFSISRKLFLGFFLVTVLPMTVGALYFYERLESHLHEDILKSSLMRTQQVREEIQRHIREIDELIDYTASQYVYNRNNDKLLVWTYHLKPAISRLVVVGSDNRVIEALCRYGYLGRGAMSPLLAFTPDMPHQKMLFFSQWQLEPQLVIVRPIIPLSTSMQQGYLMAEISMKNFFNRFNRETSGKSCTFLVNLAGKVVAHRNLNLVLKGARADGFAPVAKTLHGSSSAQGEYKDYTGQQVFGVAARIPGIPLIVVNEIPLKDAFLFVHQMRSQFLLVLLGSMFLIFFGAWIIARSITRPISLLYRAAEKIRKGDLVPVEGKFPDDEIGFFAQCFNQMILTLKVDRDFREQAEAELRESEKRYRLVADYAYDMECWRDEDGNFLHVSPSCEIITGYSRNEFYDNKFLMDEIVVAEDKHVFIDP
jgi:PAS domain-containing protein